MSICERLSLEQKNIRTKEYVYGYYWSNENGNHFIRQTVDLGGYFRIEDVEIDKETLGQFTGLYDKNGKEIYEGDILKYPSHFIGDIEVPEGIAQILFDEEEACYYLANDYGTSLFDLTRNLGCKVIGNIYENQELIKE